MLIDTSNLRSQQPWFSIWAWCKTDIYRHIGMPWYTYLCESFLWLKEYVHLEEKLKIARESLNFSYHTWFAWPTTIFLDYSSWGFRTTFVLWSLRGKMLTDAWHETSFVGFTGLEGKNKACMSVWALPASVKSLFDEGLITFQSASLVKHVMHNFIRCSAQAPWCSC